jgi:acylphosphatase
MTEKVRARVRVSGVVQGVGFRWYALRCARQHGVTGWVRNTPDGNVEIEVEGDSDAVHSFVEDVSVGPSSGEVSSVSVNRIPVEHDLSFEVKR